ncbi:MAG: hypothetical protein HZC38_12410 [Chloroflexi bacterium]|nr:hypothetical protein [Chloroflexota bacterium]
MKLNNLWNQLFPKKKPPTPAPSAQPDAIQKMMDMLAHTHEVELTCDEVCAMLDQFTELAAQGADVAHLMPLIQRHLDMCADCREEYESLKRVLQHAT